MPSYPELPEPAGHLYLGGPSTMGAAGGFLMEAVGGTVIGRVEHSHWSRLSRYYEGAKVYAITTHLKVCKMAGILCMA